MAACDGLGVGRDVVGIQNGQSPRYGWSKSRREVYAAFMGEISTWNWNDGHLKRRVRYAKEDASQFVFSPDGKWMVATVRVATRDWELRRYHIQNGHLADKGRLTNGLPLTLVLHDSATLCRFGFSADGQYLWFNQPAGELPDSFHWVRNTDAQLEQSAIHGLSCSGLSKILPDGRTGIVAANGFEWHDGEGRLLQRLPGPFQGRIFKSDATRVADWVLSPDGKWIYSAEQSGIIRRWRAR